MDKMHFSLKKDNNWIFISVFILIQNIVGQDGALSKYHLHSFVKLRTKNVLQSFKLFKHVWKWVKKLLRLIINDLLWTVRSFYYILPNTRKQKFIRHYLYIVHVIQFVTFCLNEESLRKMAKLTMSSQVHLSI